MIDGAQGLAALIPSGSGSSTLYSVNLATGATTTIGSIGGPTPVIDIALLAPGQTVYGLTSANSLIAFASNTPDTTIRNQAITGMLPGEVALGIDFRPATGGLYAVGSSGRLYTINPTTAVASIVGAGVPFSPALQGNRVSIDFDPATDRLRVVSDIGQDLVINPDDGLVESSDPPLTYVAGDPSAGLAPDVVGIAYTGAVGSAGSTMYGIDSARDNLVRETVDNSGNLATVGAIGQATTNFTGFDIASNGQAFASLTPPGSPTSLFTTINLTTGAATPIGAIAGGVTVADLAVAPSGLAQFASPAYSVSTASPSVTLVVNRVSGSTGTSTVDFATSNGSAQAGVDYFATSGVLTFGPGETSKAIFVTLIPGSVTSGSRTFNVTLTPVQGGLGVGSIASAVVTINALAPASTGTLRSADFQGPAPAVSSVLLSFSGPIDPNLASDPSRFAVEATALKSSTATAVSIASATYSVTAHTVLLTFTSPIALAPLSAPPGLGDRARPERGQRDPGLHPPARPDRPLPRRRRRPRDPEPDRAKGLARRDPPGQRRGPGRLGGRPRMGRHRRRGGETRLQPQDLDRPLHHQRCGSGCPEKS